MNIKWWWLFVIFAVTVVTCTQDSQHRFLNVVILGRSGGGKSSLINFMINSGKEVAKEGEFASITTTVTFYNITHFNLNLADSPGLFDTTGYTNDEITQLIKSSIITQSNHTTAGVILMFNAESVKLYLQDMINGAVQIFGEDILENTLFVFNRNDKIDTARQSSIAAYLQYTLKPIFANFGYKHFNLNLADSPGLFDTTGYTNDEMTQLIKSSIITQSNHTIAGVILMFNAESVKLWTPKAILIHIHRSYTMQWTVCLMETSTLLNEMKNYRLRSMNIIR